MARTSSKKASTSRKKTAKKAAKKATKKTTTASKTTRKSTASARAGKRAAAKKSTRATTARKVKKAPARGTARSRSAAPRRAPQTHPEAAPLDASVPQLKPAPRAGKRVKNQAGLSTKDLQHFRGLLLEKRRELVGDMSAMETEALRSSSGTNLSNLPLHMADMGTDNYEQEFTLGLVEKDRQLLREINHALSKIQDGRYGVCEATGKPISKPRLEAQPWARHSIEYARAMEKNRFRH